MLTRSFAATLCLVAITASAQPAIQISSPQTPNDAVYKRNLLPVRGFVTSEHGIVEITVGGVSLLPVSSPTLTGEVTYEFARRVRLSKGENLIELTATDFKRITVKTSLTVQATFPSIDDPATFMPIAVLGIYHGSDGGGYSRNDLLTSYLERELQKRFQIIDRSNIDQVLNEQQINASTLLSDDSLSQIGQAFKTEYLLVGKIEPFKNDLKLIITLLQKNSAMRVKFETIIHNIDGPKVKLHTVRDIAQQIEDQFPRVTGTVTQARGSTAILDYNENLGVRSGAWILFLRVVEEAFIDEDTGEVLMPEAYGVGGRGRISRIQDSNTMVDIESLEEGFTVEAGTPVITW